MFWSRSDDADERVREAFIESVQAVLVEMEHFAAVRERRGDARDTEAFRLTGNFAGAMFVHDASRSTCIGQRFYRRKTTIEP